MNPQQTKDQKQPQRLDKLSLFIFSLLELQKQYLDCADRIKKQETITDDKYRIILQKRIEFEKQLEYQIEDIVFRQNTFKLKKG